MKMLTQPIKTLSAILLSFSLCSAVHAQEQVELEQGSIIPWETPGAEKLTFLGKTSIITDGVAYLSADFAKKPGIYTAKARGGGKNMSLKVKIIEKDYGTEEIEFPEDKMGYVNLSGEDQERHWADQKAVKKVIKGSGGKAKFTLPMGKPAKDLPLGEANFAVKRIFNGVKKNPHTGQDYPTPIDTPIIAMADGTVALTGDHFFAGNSVYIDHGDDLVTMYFHLKEILVKEGDEVKKGDVVAKSGDTGRGTGAHLHLGARWHNRRIDPKLLYTEFGTEPEVAEPKAKQPKVEAVEAGEKADEAIDDAADATKDAADAVKEEAVEAGEKADEAIDDAADATKDAADAVKEEAVEAGEKADEAIDDAADATKDAADAVKEEAIEAGEKADEAIDDAADATKDAADAVKEEAVEAAE